MKRRAPLIDLDVELILWLVVLGVALCILEWRVPLCPC